MKPLNDNLIVKLTEKTTQTESGFIIPESAVEQPQTATVIAISDEQEKVKINDNLILRQHAGLPFTHENEQFHLIHIADIIAVVN